MTVSGRDSQLAFSLLWLLLLACLAPRLGYADPQNLPEVKGFREFFSLPLDRASNGCPVRIQGVVLCYDRGWDQLYIHDGQQTAWLSPQKFPGVFEPGQFVELRGQTQLESGSPGWTNLSLTVLGREPLPAPVKLGLGDFADHFGQWVETEGWVRVAEPSQGPLCLVLRDQGHNALIYVFGKHAAAEARQLVGSKLRVRGINASRLQAGQLVSAAMMVPGSDQVETITRAPADTLKEPVISID
ncbi:MAG TPA: hypothetical protein VHI52_15510, partial [Verrucomicrobiae bacterium]|nr:hypothetical protein [Verrucomicrobiae bacterium]